MIVHPIQCYALCHSWPAIFCGFLPGVYPALTPFIFSVWGKPVLGKNRFWRNGLLFERFSYVVCSHPMCSWSISSIKTVSGSENRSTLCYTLGITNVVRTVTIDLDVDYFRQLAIYFILLLWTPLSWSVGSAGSMFRFLKEMYPCIVVTFLSPIRPNFSWFVQFCRTLFPVSFPFLV